MSMMMNPIVPPFLPALIRDPASYPGQMGVPGADVNEGFRMLPSSRTLYVDNTHGNANDSNDGTDASFPLNTIQGAVDKITNSGVPGDTIIVQAGEYTENVVTGSWTATPNYCNIIGAGPHRYRPYWDSGDNSLPALDVRTMGWRISGFRFGGKSGAAAVQLRHFDSGASDTSTRTIIDNCYFDGLQVGLYGIEMHGGYDVWIYNNTFAFWHNAIGGGAIAIRNGATPVALPYRVRIYGNEFYDNDNHLYAALNGSFVIGNIFKVDGTVGYAPTFVCSTTGSAGGNSNLVTQNMMPGDYSVVGGYVATATDSWVGNMADDITEGEVGDNGWSVSPPA